MNLIRSVLCSKEKERKCSKVIRSQCKEVGGGGSGGKGSNTGGDKDERKAGGRIRKDVLAMVA